MPPPIKVLICPWCLTILEQNETVQFFVGTTQRAVTWTDQVTPLKITTITCPAIFIALSLTCEILCDVGLSGDPDQPDRSRCVYRRHNHGCSLYRDRHSVGHLFHDRSDDRGRSWSSVHRRRLRICFGCIHRDCDLNKK